MKRVLANDVELKLKEFDKFMMIVKHQKKDVEIVLDTIMKQYNSKYEEVYKSAEKSFWEL